MLLLFISFVAGVLTILAPCVLPLIPVIVGGSLSDSTVNKKKALTIVISLGISVIVFTLLLKVSTLFITIPEYVWRYISGGLILTLGLITLFPSLWENQMLAKLNIQSNMLLGKGVQKKSFYGDVIIGAALGPVFSTCSPTYFIILATVLPVSPILGIVYLLSYAIGLCLSLLLVTLIGQRILIKLNIASDPRGWFKKLLGVLFLIVGFAILFGFDKKTQLFLLDSGVFDVTKVEQRLLEENKSASIVINEKDTSLVQAPELSSIDGYVNTNGKPITLAELKGKKVVLLDIWTYSCINCQRTIPYLNLWYEKYKDQGLEIVGLHTPEFAFEKVQANVENAVKKFNIKYPVILDNDYSTWNALGNQYWPRKYLIDIDGYIVYDHIGEGGYEETEKQIQKALKELNERLNTQKNVSTEISKPENVVSMDGSKVRSPEVYFGSGRNEYLANGKVFQSGIQTFTLPSTIFPNKLYLSGTWNITTEDAENKNAASIVFSYDARNVYMAAGTSAEIGMSDVEIEIYQDDTFIKKIKITGEQLYTLIEGTDYGKHVLKIVIPKAGLKAFTFTFG